MIRVRSNLKLSDDIVLGYENHKTMHQHRTAMQASPQNCQNYRHHQFIN
ncbi:MAG: hypothetical protein RLZZ507_4207 [Cyanobacteriota bacterium]|jgi:hypothetical protein